ncbi:MAG: NAD-dependent epimerase/dehydratase family protein [Deltaproteobacteria bacterium]|nr:NAD-dependent epimerase/dehydratase family protein [Deltaproteobacteria bacterium]
MKRRFLVTGGTGFLGGALVRRLVEAGHFVRVLDNDARGSFERLADIRNEVEFVKADIRDAEAVIKACKNIDVVCHLAFINGTEYFYSHPDLVMDVGIRGMLNILDGCKENKIREFILASSSEVYQMAAQIPTDETVALTVPDPKNPRYSYGGSKLITELMAFNYGKKLFDRVCVFRPHNVYGPMMGFEHVIPQFILRIKNLESETTERPLPFAIQGSGKETRAFIYIDDFTEALMKVVAIGKHNEIYHLGTMDEISINQLAESVAKAMKTSLRLMPGDLLVGSTPRRCPDTRKVQALGFSPHFSLDQGLAKTVEWYLKNAETQTKKVLSL